MYYGDYHTHTIYSHGTGTIEQNVICAREKGLKEVAITDHGFGHMAYGVKRKKWAEMRATVERLNGVYPDIKIMLGLECNFISRKGNVDLRENEDKLLDIEVCGFHKFARPMNIVSAFNFAFPNVAYSVTNICSRKLMAKNTDSYIKLIENNEIDILSHMNYAICSDAVEVAKACMAYGTYVELNGKRINFTDAEAEKMIESGVTFIVDSDAHAPEKVGDFTTPESFITRYNVPEAQIANLNKKPRFRSCKN